MTIAQMASVLVLYLEELRLEGSQEWWGVDRWFFAAGDPVSFNFSVRDGHGERMWTVQRALRPAIISNAPDQSLSIRSEVETAYRMLRARGAAPC